MDESMDGPSCDQQSPQQSLEQHTGKRRAINTIAIGSSVSKVPRQDESSVYCTPSDSSSSKGDDQSLRRHMCLIVNLVNLETLVPVLNKYNVITKEESEHLLNTNLPSRQRKRDLTTFLESKGTSGHSLFLRALKEETEHCGHKELHDLLVADGCDHVQESWNLADQLRQVYLQDGFGFNIASGPRLTAEEFIRLALVERSKVNPEKADEFISQTIHGNVDDILFKKRRLAVEEIFKCKNQKGRKVVLAEGAPGIGKTILATYLSQQWARGELLHEFDIVLFVPLCRISANMETVMLKDILGIYFSTPALCDEVAKNLEEASGQKMLLIFDGWDELPKKLKSPTEFFMNAINGLMLPSASVLVTSRPATENHKLFFPHRHIEVLGFESQQIKSYLTCHLSRKDDEGKQQSAEDVWCYFEQYPNIKALAHIPLCLSIICAVIKKDDRLPETITELYSHYIRQVIDINKAKHKKSNKYVSNVLDPLKKIALSGIASSKYVFTAADLIAEGISLQGHFDGLGTLKMIDSLQKTTDVDFEALYQFQHTTVQEFLAAKAILELNEAEKTLLLDTHRANRWFYNTWKFFAGLTDLDADKQFKDAIFELANSKNFRDILFLLHCSYEAHRPDICLEIAHHVQFELNFSNAPLNPADCLCAAYTAVSAGGNWTLNFRGSHIGYAGLKVLHDYLIKTHLRACAHSIDEDYSFRIAVLDLTKNDLKADTLMILTDLLKGPVVIEHLDLSLNSSLGDKGFEVFTSVLKTNHYLKELRFGNCNLTAENAKCLGDMLAVNSHIKRLHLSYESKIGDDGICSLAYGLLLNTRTALTDLRVGNVGMKSHGLNALANCLATNTCKLEILWIGYHDFNLEDCTTIASIIKTAKSLKELKMSRVPAGDEGFSKIVDALESSQSSLKALWVFSCDIHSKGMERLSAVLKRNSTSLEEIQLGGNPIGEEGAKHLIAGINENRTLKEVWLENVKLSKEMKSALQRLNSSREGLLVSFENCWKHRKEKHIGQHFHIDI